MFLGESQLGTDGQTHLIDRYQHFSITGNVALRFMRFRQTEIDPRDRHGVWL